MSQPNLNNHDIAVNSQSSESATSQGANHSSEPMIDRAINAIANFASVSELLRLLGAIAVLVSMSMFLLQGWSETGDFQRFCMMVGQTVLLGFAGFSMFKWLRETKSARLFFGLSLVSVTANFTTLAALIYSVFSLDGQSADYPSFAHWVATDIGTLLASIGIAGIILVPLSLLAFSILARPAAKTMTVWYLGMNMLLLLPVREVGIIAILVLIATVLLMKSPFMRIKALDGSSDIAKANFSWGTREGKFARLVMFLPLVIMMVRSLLHYDVSNFSMIAIFSATYWFAVQAVNIIGQRFESLLTIIAAISAWIVAFTFVSQTQIFGLPSVLLLPTFALMITAACVDLARRATSSTLRSMMVGVTAMAVVASFGLNHLIYHSTVSFILGFVAGVATLCAAYWTKSQWLGALSAVLLIGLPAYHAENILNLVFDSGWLGFAITGVSVIILASVIDRYGAIIKLKFSKNERALGESEEVDVTAS